MSGKNTAPLETTATAKAVAGNVESLTEVVSSLDKLAQGDYALRLLLAANTVSELRSATPAVHRLLVDARAPIIEETYGNLSAFYAMFPGNRQFNVYLQLAAEFGNQADRIVAEAQGRSQGQIAERVPKTMQRVPSLRFPWTVRAGPQESGR